MKLILLLLVILACITQQINAASPEEEQKFVTAVKSAFAKKDPAALAALTCWDRVPDNLKQRQLKGYASEMKWEANEVSLTKPEQPDQEWKDKNGVSFKFNLTITKWLRPSFPAEAHLKIWHSVGEKDGKLFIAAPAPVQ